MFAGIIGLGCAIGIRKMARISKLINEAELENAVNWYFSLDKREFDIKIEVWRHDTTWKTELLCGLRRAG